MYAKIYDNTEIRLIECVGAKKYMENGVKTLRLDMANGEYMHFVFVDQSPEVFFMNELGHTIDRMVWTV